MPLRKTAGGAKLWPFKTRDVTPKNFEEDFATKGQGLFPRLGVFDFGRMVYYFVDTKDRLQVRFSRDGGEKWLKFSPTLINVVPDSVFVEVFPGVDVLFIAWVGEEGTGVRNVYISSLDMDGSLKTKWVESGWDIAQVRLFPTRTVSGYGNAYGSIILAYVTRESQNDTSAKLKVRKVPALSYGFGPPESPLLEVSYARTLPLDFYGVYISRYDTMFEDGYFALRKGTSTTNGGDEIFKVFRGGVSKVGEIPEGNGMPLLRNMFINPKTGMVLIDTQPFFGARVLRSKDGGKTFDTVVNGIAGIHADGFTKHGMRIAVSDSTGKLFRSEDFFASTWGLIPIEDIIKSIDGQRTWDFGFPTRLSRRTLRMLFWEIP